LRIFGADLPRGGSGGENTLVSTDDSGSIVSARHLAGLPSVAEAIRQRAAGEPFLVAVNLPVVVPSRAARGRPVENLVRRRFGVRLRPGGRAALSAEATGVASEALLAGLAAAGHPCLPYPDRDGRASGLAEIHPELVLKALLWEVSGMSHAGSGQRRAELFRAYAAPAYRARDESKRSSWADRAVALDLAQRALGSPRFYDLRPAREALDAASSPRDVERAGALLDAALVAGTARRYVESPEECLFFGDRETGYVILPADAFVRRLALHDVRPQRGQLFPKTSLQERLGDDAELRPLELLTVEGRPQQIEAEFRKRPVYEFDNVDEMLWWKHCRHLSGPALPTEGLKELVVLIGGGEAAAGPGRGLRLVRSRHRTLSFRFDPTGEWRSHLPTRDGRTYALHVLRAVYDTAASEAP
jgi:predicted RNase H-like nuclease